MNAPRLAASLIALALGIGMGCSSKGGGAASGGSGPSAGTAAARIETYVYVVDWSGSTAPARRRLLGAIVAEVEALPPGTRVVLYRMASETRETYDGDVVAGTVDGIAAALVGDALKSDGRTGTVFADMARALRAFSESYSGGPFAVRVLTDGGDDNAAVPTSAATYRLEASKLCADRRLADLAFYGVGPGFRESIREAFSAAGPRLRILRLGEGLAP